MATVDFQSDFLFRPLLSHTENRCITDTNKLKRHVDGQTVFQLFTSFRIVGSTYRL